MAHDLREFIIENRPTDFIPKPIYDMEDDSVTYYFENVPTHARRVDSVLTLYMGPDEKVAGYCLKGVKSLLETLGEFDFEIRVKSVKLSQILAAYFLQPLSMIESTKEFSQLLKRVSVGHEVEELTAA